MAGSDDDAAGGETAPEVPAEEPGGKKRKKKSESIVCQGLCTMSLRAELLWQPQRSFEGVIAEKIQNMCNLLWTPDKDRRLEHGLQVAGLVFWDNQLETQTRVLQGVRIDSHGDKVLAASGALQ